MTLTIATRESPLALWQARWVKERLEYFHSGLKVRLLGLTTTADKMLATPLYKVGGKGLFVKELEEALLTGRADIAVHSMKDVPMNLPNGLALPVMCEREDPRDAFVSNHYASLDELPKNAMIGTSSLRRQSQILALRADLKTAFLRGNVNTRLAKLDDEEYAAIILAVAGLKRLGVTDRIRSYLSLEQSLPAAGQGVMGIECRENDERVKAFISPLNHIDSFTCVTAERAMCRYLNGSCQTPIGAYAELNQNNLRLRGLTATPDGTTILRAEATGVFDAADALGVRVAQDLLQQGAQEILDSLTD